MSSATLPTSTDQAEVDLAAYRARIGYHGALVPTLETLARIVELHAATIPFEAIDVLLDRRVDLSPTAVDAKLLGGGRGGYCYEQNGLLKRVLEAIGFVVEGLVARVIWMTPQDAAPRPATHMVLRVWIDGSGWLADVGFGSCVPPAPLRLDTREPQPTRHETFRLMPVEGELQLEALIADEWQPLYRLTGVPQLDVDYELANWYTSTHPSSRFRNRLIVARSTPEARLVLAGARLTVRTPGGSIYRRILSADEIEDALASRFQLRVEPEWRPIIERTAMEAAAAA